MNFFDKNCSEYNTKKVKNIISNIESRIKENVAKFHNSIVQDNKTFFERFEFSTLISTMERSLKEDWVMEKNNKNQFYTGIGNIGVCYKGTSDIVLYLALKALKTNNNIIFFEESDIHETSKIIIDIVNEECIKCNYNVCIKIEKYNKVTDFIDDTEDFNMFIFINDVQKYLDFSARNKSDMKILCSGYGSMDLFLDDKNLKDTLLEIDNYVYNNNIELELYKDENVEEVVKNINIGKHNYCAIIFTQNKDDAYYFIKNVKAEKIFVNKNPINEYKFELEDKDLIKSKKIYI